MSVTRETCQFPIGPCGPLEQSPPGDSSRHALTAPLSSILDFGENAAVGVGAEQSGKVVKLRSVEWKDGSVTLNVLRQRSRGTTIVYVHLHAHHCSIAVTCRQGALAKDTKANESLCT